MVDIGCPENPKVNSGVICYITISGWVPPFCGFYISMALKSDSLSLPFASVFTGLSVWIWMSISLHPMRQSVCTYASLCIALVWQCMPASWSVLWWIKYVFSCLNSKYLQLLGPPLAILLSWYQSLDLTGTLCVLDIPLVLVINVILLWKDTVTKATYRIKYLAGACLQFPMVSLWTSWQEPWQADRQASSRQADRQALVQ